MRHRLTAWADERHELRERHERAAFGCGLLVAGVWSLLLAALVLAATRWLILNA